MKKFFNIELDKKSADNFKVFLKESGFYYEASGAGDLVHLEIKLDETGVKMCNNWLNYNL